MPKEIKGYFLFDTIKQVFHCEKICVQNKLQYKLGPVPRNLSSDCGVCLHAERLIAKEIEVIMLKSRIKYRDLCYQ